MYNVASMSITIHWLTCLNLVCDRDRVNVSMFVGVMEVTVSSSILMVWSTWVVVPSLPSNVNNKRHID